jgi:hypothetical protein
MYKLLLALLLLPSVAYGEVLAVIKAPEKANIGDLVILDSSASIGDNRLWVVDPKAEGRYLILDERIVFAIGTPGTYSFQLIVADTDAAISQVSHNVQIGGSVVPPPPTDPNPPPTEPVPVPDRTVFKAVRAATNFVNDPPTAAQLKQALLSLPEKTPATVQAAIGDVLLKRADQTKDWFTFWRVPVNAAIDAAKLPYAEAVKQIIEGLDANVSQSASTIVLYVRDNCPPCDKWKNEVAPRLIALGWVIDPQDTTTKPTPSFQINTDGKTKEVAGFLPFDEFCSLVLEMRK